VGAPLTWPELLEAAEPLYDRTPALERAGNTVVLREIRLANGRARPKKRGGPVIGERNLGGGIRPIEASDVDMTEQDLSADRQKAVAS
jgi:hypothetical protein